MFRTAARTTISALLTFLATAGSAGAQSTSLTGNVSALVDALPNVPRAETVTELRIRAIADLQIEAKPWLRFRFAGLADGLVADRGGTMRDATADALEAWVEVSGARGDLRAGVGRIAWGRLDEVQPTDVINPIDVSRFLLDGRSEARMAVPYVRARIFESNIATLEGVLVPSFRRGRFDRLDEETSPFNLYADFSPAALPPYICGSSFRPPCPERFTLTHHQPRGVQAGGRASFTTGRVDWSLSAWRGFLPFGVVQSLGVPEAVIAHPRYTMFGADIESVAGKWAWRAEAAYFPNRPTQADVPLRPFESDALEAGAGVDRRAGDFTLSATLLLRRDHRMYRVPQWPGPRESYRILEEPRTDLSVVAGFSRTYDRDRIETRLFALINPADKAGFLRGLLAWKPIDNVAIETSVGWFAGEGEATSRTGVALQDLSPLRDRDFGYIRLKYYFGR